VNENLRRPLALRVSPNEPRRSRLLMTYRQQKEHPLHWAIEKAGNLGAGRHHDYLDQTPSLGGIDGARHTHRHPSCVRKRMCRAQ
jgi:hypothetical protein